MKTIKVLVKEVTHFSAGVTKDGIERYRFVGTNETGKEIAFFRQPKQIIYDLKNSQLIDDEFDAADLRKFLVAIKGTECSFTGDYNKAGSTYIADENSSVVKSQAHEEYTVERNGKAVKIKVGQSAQIGDIVVRQNDGYQIEGFVAFDTIDVESNINLSTVLAHEKAKQILRRNNSLINRYLAPTAPVVESEGIPI